MKRRIDLAVLCLACGLTASYANAELADQHASDAKTASSENSSSLTEIVVTAEKRTENAQVIPIALSVLSDEDLRKNSIAQIDDLQYSAPSLTVSDNGITKYVNIRGIGLGVSAPGVSNGVAYFIDGLFLPDASLYADDPYFDLERVEILRGPQGTLVGQNSTGGAIYVVSKLPTLGVTGADIEQTVGNYNELRTRGAVNLPLSENWAARVAFQVEHRDSFYQNQSPAQTPGQTDNNPGDLDRYSARIGVLGQVNEDLTVILRSEFQVRKSGGPVGKPIAGDPPDAPYVGAAPANPFAVSYDSPTYDNLKASESSVELKWNIDPTLSLRSLTGLTAGSRQFYQDDDGSSLPGSTHEANTYERNYSQEFDLVYASDKLRWVSGTFLLYQHLGGVNYFDTTSPPFTPETPATTIASGRFDNSSVGLFSQANYDLTDQLEVVGGLRYSRDRTSDAAGNYSEQGGHTHPSIGSEIDHAVTGKAALNYKATPTEFLYLSASRGYKAGGFNDATSKFLPEFVWSYETGVKSTLLDGHVRLQNDVYFNNYSNIQVPVYDTFLAFSNVGNGTSARVYGAESQAQAKIDGVGFDASAAYNHSRLNSINLINPRILPFGGTIPLCSFGPGPCTFNFAPYTENLTGKTLPYAPQWTAALGVDYDLNVGNGTLTPRLTVSYLSRQFASLFGDVPADVIPAHTIASALLTYAANNHWRLEAYVTNLTSKVYIAGKFDELQYYGRPRQFGVRAGYSF